MKKNRKYIYGGLVALFILITLAVFCGKAQASEAQLYALHVDVDLVSESMYVQFGGNDHARGDFEVTVGIDRDGTFAVFDTDYYTVHESGFDLDGDATPECTPCANFTSGCARPKSWGCNQGSCKSWICLYPDPPGPQDCRCRLGDCKVKVCQGKFETGDCKCRWRMGSIKEFPSWYEPISGDVFRLAVYPYAGGVGGGPSQPLPDDTLEDNEKEIAY